MCKLIAVALVAFVAACTPDTTTPDAATPSADAGSPSPIASATAPLPSPSITFGREKVLIATDDGPVLLDVEVADTDVERQQGLMFRSELGPDAGMVFVFFEDHRGGFWMKNTLIPLSIAFFDADGHIKRILDMEPCEADPCPVYDPGVAYRGALEVNEGAFERWGVSVGDRVTLVR